MGLLSLLPSLASWVCVSASSGCSLFRRSLLCCSLLCSSSHLLVCARLLLGSDAFHLLPFRLLASLPLLPFLHDYSRATNALPRRSGLQRRYRGTGGRYGSAVRSGGHAGGGKEISHGSVLLDEIRGEGIGGPECFL